MSNVTIKSNYDMSNNEKSMVSEILTDVASRAVGRKPTVHSMLVNLSVSKLQEKFNVDRPMLMTPLTNLIANASAGNALEFTVEPGMLALKRNISSDYA